MQRLGRYLFESILPWMARWNKVTLTIYSEWVRIHLLYREVWARLVCPQRFVEIIADVTIFIKLLKTRTRSFVCHFSVRRSSARFLPILPIIMAANIGLLRFLPKYL